MVMTARDVRWIGLVVGMLAIAGCEKPSEDACRKAIANMRALSKTESLVTEEETRTDVRRCKGGSSKKAVECAANAKTLEELIACDFMKGATLTAPSSSGSGSSAAPGSGSPSGSSGSGGAPSP